MWVQLRHLIEQLLVGCRGFLHPIEVLQVTLGVLDRVVSLLLDKNQAPRLYRTLTHVQILEGICKWLIRLASPTGFEPVLPP